MSIILALGLGQTLYMINNNFPSLPNDFRVTPGLSNTDALVMNELASLFYLAH